jgi:hypothetical protein
MSESLESLKEAMDNARIVTFEARKAQEVAENAYAKAKAELVGVRIGSIVRTMEHLYLITDIKNEDWSKQGFKPYGAIIRKDGTSGQVHEIWRNWELEPTGEEQA